MDIGADQASFRGTSPAITGDFRGD